MGNWVTLPAPAVTGYSGCTEVHALDENTLLVAGLSPPAGVEGLTPAFLKTTDGGQTWSGKAVSELGASSNGRAAQLHFADAMVGYMAWDSGVRAIAVTTDGGATWSASSVPAGEPQYVYAIDGTTALASGRIGTSSAIWRSANTGKTWTPVYTGAAVLRAGRIMMFDDRVGLAQTERLARTTDGGQSWSPLSVGFRWNGPWSRVSATQAFVIYNSTGGISHLYRTDDAGQTFTLVGATTLPCTASALAFLDPMHGLLGCGASQRTTSDGGVTWIAEPPPPGWSADETCMAWPSATAAYVLGAPSGDMRAIKRTGDLEPMDGVVDASIDGALDASFDGALDAPIDALAASEAGAGQTNPGTGDGGGGCCETGGGGSGPAILAAGLALVLARRRR